MSNITTILFSFCLTLFATASSVQAMQCQELFRFRTTDTLVGDLQSVVGRKVLLSIEDYAAGETPSLSGFMKKQKARLVLLGQIRDQWFRKSESDVQQKMAKAFENTPNDVIQKLTLEGLNEHIFFIEAFVANHIQSSGMIQGTIESVSSFKYTIRLEDGQVRNVFFDLARTRIRSILPNE